MGIWAMVGIGVAGMVGGMAQSSSQAKAANSAMGAEWDFKLATELTRYGSLLSASSRRRAAKTLQNNLNFEVVTRNFARQQLDLAQSQEERRDLLSEAQKSRNASLGAMATAKLGNASGTAEAIKRQMEIKGRQNWYNEFMNTAREAQALKVQYENNLLQSQDLSADIPPLFAPGLPPIMADVGETTFWGGFQGGIQGLQTGAGMANAYSNYMRT